MNREDEGSRGRSLTSTAIDRRRFLALTGGGVAWGALPGFVEAALPVEYPLSIGYVEGSDRMGSLADLPWHHDTDPRYVLPAAGLPSGDGAMALEMLSVRIAGLYPAWPWPAKRRPDAIDLDVLFEPFDPYVPSPLPFAAWSYRRLPARNLSAPVRFDFQMEASDGLGLRLRTVERGGGRTDDFYGAFTVDTTAGLARLQRGIYLLGIDRGTFDGEVEIPGYRGDPDYTLRAIVLTVEAPGRVPPSPPGPAQKPRR